MFESSITVQISVTLDPLGLTGVGMSVTKVREIGAGTGDKRELQCHPS